MEKRHLWLFVVSATGLLHGEETAVVSQGWYHSKKAGRYDVPKEATAKLARWAEESRIDLRLRTLWLDESAGASKTTATAVGGHFGFSTPDVYGVSGRIKAYTSQKFWGINPSNEAILNPELYRRGTESFTYIAEAEADYEWRDLSVRAGRMRIETPFADPDDIRMAPNTFEGVALSYRFDGSLTFNTMFLTRWAGFDSGEAQTDFVRFAEDSAGMAMVGAAYRAGETEVSFWYYRVDRLYDLVYAEAVGNRVLSAQWHVDWGIQGAWMDERDGSGIGGSVVGLTGMVHYRNFYGGAAYNYAFVDDGMAVTDGMGGGPYFTSLDEATVASASALAPGHDISVYRLGGGLDLAWWLHDSTEEGLHLEAMFGEYDFKSSPVTVSETDAMLWLALTDRIRLDAVFADFEVRGAGRTDDGDFRRVWIRAEYGF